MTEDKCGVIKDLLPLYIESACGRESSELVRTHLEQCEKCKKLHSQMVANLLQLEREGYDTWAAFKKTGRVILWIVLAVVAVINCYTTNTGLAMWGGEVTNSHLGATVMYVIFWGVLTVMTRNVRMIARFNFVASLVSLFVSVGAALYTVFHVTGILYIPLVILAPTVAVPMAGLLRFFDWTGVYCVAAAICAVWVAFTWWNMRRLKRLWGKMIR